MNMQVRNVRDYLKWVHASHYSISKGLKWYHTIVFYRGQANKVWELKPSLFRKNVSLEHLLLQSACNTLWNDLRHMSSCLEKLIFLQHYGLPTRLLDVTTNPLVALYFACMEEKDEQRNEVDGIVWCGYPRNENANNVEQMCEIPFKHELQDIVSELEGMDLSNLHDKAKVTSAYFINPPMNNSRIIAQNGAFIFSPLLEYDKNAKTYLLNSQTLQKNVFSKKLIIPALSKKVIRKELLEYGIHEGSLFPDAEHKISYLQESIKNSLIEIAMPIANNN